MITQGSLGDSWAMDPWNPWTHGTLGVFLYPIFEQGSKRHASQAIERHSGMQTSIKFYLKNEDESHCSAHGPHGPPMGSRGTPMKSARVSHEDPGMCFK